MPFTAEILMSKMQSTLYRTIKSTQILKSYRQANLRIARDRLTSTQAACSQSLPIELSGRCLLYQVLGLITMIYRRRILRRNFMDLIKNPSKRLLISKTYADQSLNRNNGWISTKSSISLAYQFNHKSFHRLCFLFLILERSLQT